MAKKSKTARNKKEEVDSDRDALSDGHTIDDFDAVDLMSTGSLESAANAASHRHDRLLEALSLAEDMNAQSSSQRLATLKTLFHAVTHYGTNETMDTDVVVAAAKQGIRVGDAAEQYAACRVVEALSIVVGSVFILDDLRQALMNLLLSNNTSTSVRIAAIRALSILHIMCGTDVEPMLDICEQVAEPEWRNHTVPPLLRTAALECWALLATALFESLSDDTGRGTPLFPLLQECLADSTMDLQVAAGQCLALIHECRWRVGGDKFVQGSWEGSPHEEIISELQHAISELATESANHLSKKVKKEQRSTFRDYRATIVDDEAPDETITFRGGSITLTTWRELIPLNFIRHCLQGGFQIQLLTNPTLQTMFGADATVLNGVLTMSQLEKRLLLSKTSEVYKNADQKLTKDRRKRNHIKNHFLTADAESLYE